MAKRSKRQKQATAAKIAEIAQPAAPVQLEKGAANVSLSFEQLQATHTLSNCSHCLNEISDKFRIVTSLNWPSLFGTGRKSGKDKPGLNYEQGITVKFPIPPDVPEERLSSFRITQTARVIGYRSGDTFRVVWIDPFHDYC